MAKTNDDDVELTEEQEAAMKRIQKKVDKMPPGSRTIQRTTREEYVKSPEDDEEDLPDGEDLSTPEIRAAKLSKGMSLMDLLPKVGYAEFQNWQIKVYRKGPAMFKEFKCQPGIIDTLKVGMTFDELEERIKKANGGGDYMVVICDEAGYHRRTRQFSVTGLDPKPSEYDYPGYHEDRKEKESEEDARKSKRIIDKEEELEEARIDKEIKKLVGLDQSSQERDRGAWGVVAQALRTSADQNAAVLQAVLNRPQEQKESLAKSLVEVLPLILPILEKILRGNNDKEMMYKQMFEMQKQQTELMISTISQKQDFTPMQMAMDMQMHKEDSIAKVYEMMLPFLADMVGEDDPKLKFWREIAGWVNEGLGKIGDIASMWHKYGGKQLPPAGSVPGIPGPQPQEPEIKPTPSSQPPPPPEAPGAQANPQQEEEDLDPTDLVAGEFSRRNYQEKVLYVFNFLLQEAEKKNPPETSGFVFLFTLDDMPEDMVNLVVGSKDAVDLRERIVSSPKIRELGEETVKQIAVMLDNQIYQYSDRIKWLDSCLSMIRGIYEEDVQEPQPEPSGNVPVKKREPEQEIKEDDSDPDDQEDESDDPDEDGDEEQGDD